MDRLLEIIITYGPIALAGMGLYVSIRPPAKPAKGKPWAHWLWFGAFAVIGSVTATASYLEMREADTQNSVLVTTQTETKTEIKDLISSINNLSTGVEHISTNQDYQILTNSRANTLIQTLKPFANSSVKFSFSCSIGDSKACFLASQWSGILKLAGWSSEGVSQDVFDTPPFGVFIAVSNPETPNAGVLQRAFLTTGIVAEGQIDPKVPTQEIDILFGAYKSSN